MNIDIKIKRVIGGKNSFDDVLRFKSKKELDRAINKARKNWFNVYDNKACMSRDENIEVGSIVLDLYKYGKQFETYETWTIVDVKVSCAEACRYPGLIADTLDNNSHSGFKVWSRKAIDEARKQHQRIPWPEIKETLFGKLRCMSDKEIVKLFIED